MLAFLGVLSNAAAKVLMDTFGMSVPLYALVFGIISGLTLPIGAFLGIWLSPVNDSLCAGMMALGAGALLFAVTVELYGHALHELAHGKLGLLEMFVTMGGAVAGALFYLTVNKWIDEKVSAAENEGPLDAEGQEESKAPSESPSESTPLKRPSLARSRWKKAVTKIEVMHLLKRDNIEGRRGRDKALMTIAAGHVATDEDKKTHQAMKARQVALSLFMGILIDGVPEGILMGFLAAEGHLTLALIFSLLIANFPEAFSSASLSTQAGMWWVTIICMWGGLCILTGSLCGLSCWFMLWMYPDFATNPNLPYHVRLPVALVEGLTGGAMIACIAAVMLPEAFSRGGGGKGPVYFSSGFLCPMGFLVAVTMKCLGG